MKFALVGKDVSKSISPQIHHFIAQKLNLKIEYDKISIPEEEFESRIDGIIEAYDGLNVTIPYKLAVIHHLENTEGDAKSFGAVNTVKCKARMGDNTDGLGFMLLLKHNNVEVSGKDMLIIGAGGAGRSVAKELSNAGANVFVYDKNFANSHAVASEFKGVCALDEIKLTPYYAVINASGVGMHKTEGVSPVGENLLKLCTAAIDLIYVPPKSEFLKIAERCGKKIVNGLDMLFYQAYYSQCVWFDLKPDEEQAKLLFEDYLKENK